MNARNEKFLFPRARWVSAVFAVMALLLAACGSSGAGNATPTVPPAAAPATIASTAAPAATTVISAVTPSGSAVPSSTGVVPATGATPGAPATKAAASPVVNVVANPKLGNILVDDKGMTLYILTKDPPDQSTCSANCSKLWPPLLTQGDPVAGPGADKNLIAWTALADGSRIVTYNHMPLYTFSGDNKAGDINGQGVNKVWFVISPDGKPVTTSTTQSGTGGYGSGG